MRGQSRWASVVETILNVLIGYGIALFAQIVIFSWYGIHLALSQNAAMGLIFTVVSIIRSYCLRRFFNWLHIRGILV